MEIFDTPSGRYAELHRYDEPCLSDDGFPDGYNEIWEVYTFEKEDPKSHDFVTRTFVSEYLARMFLSQNGYKEIVR